MLSVDYRVNSRQAAKKFGVSKSTVHIVEKQLDYAVFLL
ncbi:MAG: sporulation transcriptional regulator SpoIIID [Hespellia sp.]|nr:sporulation transcriptional regulator SpoIIID [Hespellia sp.]